MTLKKIIRIEEEVKLSEKKEICKKNGCCDWVMFTDLRTQSTGAMPRKQLNQLYDEMVGITSKGRKMYIRK